MRKILSFSLLGLLLPLSPTLLAQDVAQSGFELQSETAPISGTTWVSATFQNGDLLVCDGWNIERYDEGGSLLETLDTLAQFVFPSFIRLAPDESYAVLGESSQGELLQVDLSGGTGSIATLIFNYDATFEDQDHLIVSAAASGFGLGNEIWRVEVSTGNLTQLATVPGASGPVVLDELGNLYYATVSDVFPPPVIQTDLLRFDAALLASGMLLDETDATLVAGGFAGAGALAYDPVRKSLFLSENNFGTGVSRIRRFTLASPGGTILVEGRPFYTISGLEFRTNTGAAVFESYQPAQDSGLRYHSSNFVNPTERTSVLPLRPTFTLQGPGTTMVGNFDALLANGPPSGFAALTYGPQSLYDPLETPLPFMGLPLFLGLDLPTLTISPTLLSLDAAGGLQQTFFNSGALFGFAAQLILIQSDLSLAGASTAVFL